MSPGNRTQYIKIRVPFYHYDFVMDFMDVTNFEEKKFKKVQWPFKSRNFTSVNFRIAGKFDYWNRIWLSIKSPTFEKRTLQ